MSRTKTGQNRLWWKRWRGGDNKTWGYRHRHLWIPLLLHISFWKFDGRHDPMYVLSWETWKARLIEINHQSSPSPSHYHVYHKDSRSSGKSRYFVFVFRFWFLTRLRFSTLAVTPPSKSISTLQKVWSSEQFICKRLFFIRYAFQ